MGRVGKREDIVFWLCFCFGLGELKAFVKVVLVWWRWYFKPTWWGTRAMTMDDREGDPGCLYACFVPRCRDGMGCGFGAMTQAGTRVKRRWVGLLIELS